MSEPDDYLEPGLTIVIPFWDLEHEILLDAVASLAEQGRRYRTIVVDNASRAPLPELPPDVEVVRLPKRVNVGEARNAGLALVRTSHVLFLDADDALFPGSIPFLYSQLEACPEAVASAGAGALFKRGVGIVPFRRRSWTHRLLNLRRLQGRPLLLALVNTVRMILPTSCVILRTDVVRRVGGFSADEAEEDWVLSAALAFQGPVVAGSYRVRRYGLRSGSLNQLKATDWRISSHARRELRRRLRRDPHVPPLVRAGSPILALLHGKPALRRLRAWAERRLARMDVRGRVQ